MFYLTKWYGDCVAEDGTAFIGYWARVRWNWLPLTYSAVLVHRPGLPLFARYSLKRDESPAWSDTTIRWSCESLHTEARWDPLAPPIQASFPSGNDEPVRWVCHGPRCRTHVNISGVGVVTGLGYIEEIHVATRPWTLPFDQLQWGRLLTPACDIVWIGWEGDQPMTLVWRNGHAQHQPDIEHDSIRLDKGAVELRDSVPLREGPLASTALAVMRGIIFAFPKRVRRAQEQKWVSRGVLVDREGAREEGWAIHEVFRWA